MNVADAWELLIEHSTLSVGDSWEHLSAQESAGAITETVIIHADGVEVEVSIVEVDVEMVQPHVEVDVEMVRASIEVYVDQSEIVVEINQDPVEVTV